MSKTMNKDRLQALANELAKDLKTPQDLSDLSAQLTKMTVEAALNAEMDYFLDKEEGNSRNGYNRKQLKGDHGQFELNTPRGRQSKFEPQLFKKRQTRITGMDDQIMALYAKGMSTRDIVDTFEEMYGVDISPALVSQVTNSIMERIVEWQSLPLEPLCPIVYLDCIVVKIRQDKRVINKAVYLAPGINLEGKKELPGMWLSENEGAKFWLSVLTELQNRGLQHISTVRSGLNYYILISGSCFSLSARYRVLASSCRVIFSIPCSSIKDTLLCRACTPSIFGLPHSNFRAFWAGRHSRASKLYRTSVICHPNWLGFNCSSRLSRQ